MCDDDDNNNNNHHHHLIHKAVIFNTCYTFFKVFSRMMNKKCLLGDPYALKTS